MSNENLRMNLQDFWPSFSTCRVSNFLSLYKIAQACTSLYKWRKVFRTFPDGWWRYGRVKREMKTRPGRRQLGIGHAMRWVDNNQGSWKRSKSTVFVATAFATEAQGAATVGRRWSEALLTARQRDFVQIHFRENCLSTNLPWYLTSWFLYSWTGAGPSQRQIRYR